MPQTPRQSWKQIQVSKFWAPLRYRFHISRARIRTWNISVSKPNLLPVTLLQPLFQHLYWSLLCTPLHCESYTAGGKRDNNTPVIYFAYIPCISTILYYLMTPPAWSLFWVIVPVCILYLAFYISAIFFLYFDCSFPGIFSKRTIKPFPS